MYGQVNVSNLLSATVDTIRNNMQLAGIFLAIMIPVGAVMTIFQGGTRAIGGTFGLGFGFDESFLALGVFVMALVLVGVVVSVIAHYWLIAGMTRRMVSPGFDRILAYIGISILYGLGVVFGFVLLIVPGIILMVRWIAVLPLVIDSDRDAMSAFGDSLDMTNGHSWSIFGAGLILVIGIFVLSSIGGGAAIGMARVAGGSGLVIAGVIGTVAEQVGNVVSTAFCVGTYHLMRDRTETVTDVFE